MKVLTVFAHPGTASFCAALLGEFTRGLTDAGHESKVVDLYAMGFDPVFRNEDFANYVHEGIPADVLQRMDLKSYVLRAVRGRVRRFLAARWLRNRSDAEVVRLIRTRRPRDAAAQQELVAWADGLAFIAPVFWMGFPAILRGWFERVFTLGFAYDLRPEGWRGDLAGRVPLLRHQKGLIISTTLFDEKAYAGPLGAAMKSTMDDFGLRYPGVKSVEHVYFHSVFAVDDATRRGYLERAYRLGRDFAEPARPAASHPAAATATAS
jgi:NAD(P)H dehydrogenase (quinone)